MYNINGLIININLDDENLVKVTTFYRSSNSDTAEFNIKW